MKIKPVKQDSGIYNAVDTKGFERGDMGKGKPKAARIYSVFKITDGMAHCQSWNAWGQLYQEVFPVNTLEPYKKA